MKKLIALVAAMVMITGYAYAADWDFYGSARVTTFIYDIDRPGAADVDTKNLTHGLAQNARFGARVKVSDELSARVEFGSGQSADNDAVRTRLIYGTWNFGGGSLTIGQAYAPFNMFYSNQVAGGFGSFKSPDTNNASDMGLLPYGGVYTGRQPLVQLQFGGFKIAIVEPKVAADASLPIGVYTESVLPKLEASYGLKLDVVSLSVAGSYNTFDLEAPGMSVSYDSYAIAFGAKANFGAFSLGGNYYFGQNVDGIGMWVDTVTGGDINATNTGILDNDTQGYIIVAGFKMNDMIGFEAGYGSVESELDQAVSKDDASSYYLNATIAFAPGVFIVPEIGIVDQGDDHAGVEQNEILYYGLKWQINF